MNVQKGKPSVSPPVQIATQPQHLGIASVQPGGHTPPLLRPEEIQILQSQGYNPVQGYTLPTGQVPHDMNKQQQPVATGLMPAPGVAQQQAGYLQQQQQAAAAGLRTTQNAAYFQTGQPQAGMRPRHGWPSPGQTSQMYPVYPTMIGQTQGQGYPTNVMMQQQIYPPNQRMPTQYISNSQTIQQIPVGTQYQAQPGQQYGSAPQYANYYIANTTSGQVPIAQPQRPPSGSGMASTQQTPFQKRERKPIPIIDPNSGQRVQTEAEGGAKTTPPSDSARSTPNSRQQAEVSESASPPPTMSQVDIAAQFAAQVAATLRPHQSSHSPQPQEDATTEEGGQEYNPENVEEFVPASQQRAEPDLDVKTEDSPPVEAQTESCVDETPAAVEEPSDNVDVVTETQQRENTPEMVEEGSSVDAPVEPVVDESSPVDATVAISDQIETEAAPVPPEPVQEIVPPVVKSSTPPPPEEAPIETEVVEKAAPAVVSVADMSKESTPPPEPVESKDVTEDEPASGNTAGKDGKPKLGFSGKKKLRDLNRKGDEKEGTDMDAFLDAESVQAEPPSEGKEVKTPSPPKDVVKSEISVSLESEPVNNVAALGKENKMPKVEIEINNSEQTEVSRKNAKNDEKSNEVSTPASKTEEVTVNSVEKKQPTLKYKYKQDQWSPLNPEGKMQYDRDFLLQLQYSKDSMKKPESLPNLPEIIPDKAPSQPSMRGGGGGNYGNMIDFTPGFLRPTRGMGGSSGGPGGGGGGGSMSKRGSQQRNRGDVKIIKTISISTDVKLHQSENAWKPGYKDEKKSEDVEVLTADLYKKVRSILNKLTPQKFQTLIKQVQGLVIDTEARLKGVTDIIFEKAISEPAFSVAYANMCRYLLTLKVPSDTKQGETVNFRVILLTRCQREFEKDNDVQIEVDQRKKAIEEAEEDKRPAMKDELEVLITVARRRSIGNIRFIGELFKLKMLTETIMHDCVFKLLRSRDEENLECLCRLLSTIGKELESDKAKPRMDQYFQQMKKIVSEKKVSSRCRFMLQDVIDLRDSNWKPRRDDNNPKTIDQIHKDAKREASEQTMLTQLHMSQQPQQHHHQSRHNKPARGRPGGQQGGSMEEGWNTVSSKAIRNIDRNIDVSKLRIEKNADENIQLGPARSFGGWGRGSSGGGSRASKEGEKANAPGNRFSALSKEEDQRSRAFGRGVSPARGDRMRANTPGGGFSRGKVIPRSSQELERERLLSSARSIVGGRTTPPSASTSREGSRNRGASREVERPSQATKELSEEEMEKKTISIVDEYLHIQDRKEAIECVKELNSPSTAHFFVYYAINHVLERSTQARQQTGHLLHDLINQKVISVDTYLQGLTEIMQAAEDMEIDIPKIWQYLGELIGPMIQDGSVPLSFLNAACEPLKSSGGKAGNLMAEVLHDASQRLGHKIVAHLWRNNCMEWSSFVPQEKIQQFLKDKKLEFTVGPDSAPSTPTSKVSIEWIKQNLTELLQTPNCDNEKIFDWIEANIPEEITKENRFIRALMTCVCSCAITGSGNTARVEQESIKKWRSLLLKYMDRQPVFELQALYAIQALVHSLEHPSGVLRTFFDTLYDEEIISEDAFNQWEASKDEPEGKGVALKQVVQFFAWLREGEEETEDS